MINNNNNNIFTYIFRPTVYKTVIRNRLLFGFKLKAFIAIIFIV